MTPKNEILTLAEAALEWIDAVPADTVLPAMPGFDRDWASNVIDRARRLAATTSARDVRPQTATSNSDVAEALTQAFEYFDNRADVVDGDYGAPEPNKEMRLAQMCEEALSNLDAAAPAAGGDASQRISRLAADLVVSGWMAGDHGIERAKQSAERKLLDFACDEIERHMKAASPPLQAPAHSDALREALAQINEIASRRIFGTPRQMLSNRFLEINSMVRKALSALTAPAAKAPAVSEADVGRTRWRHKKRGSTYIEIGRGNLQIATSPILQDYDRMVAYQSEDDGSLWIRSEREFDDGRFELIQSAAQGDVAKSYHIEHDGFEGIQIGSYTTLEGKRGVVLQQVGTRVVHVYGEKWLKPIAGKETP